MIMNMKLRILIIPQTDKEDAIPIKIASYDIEASSSHGDFPLPKNLQKFFRGDDRVVEQARKQIK